MGRSVDLNKRLSPEDRQYLIDRGRGYLIPANERRFGTAEEPREPAPYEKEGSNAISPFYNTEDQQKAVYDKGGAPLPGTVLDYNTGRVADRADNDVLVEYTGPGHTPGAHDLSPQRGQHDDYFDSTSDDDDDVDLDIVEFVLKVKNVPTLKSHIEKLKDEHEDLQVEIDEEDKRADLENKLAISLQDLRDAGRESLPLLRGETQAVDGEGDNPEPELEDPDAQDENKE